MPQLAIRDSKAVTTEPTLEDMLVDELLLSCFAFLDPRSLCQLLQTSKKLSRIASDNSLWRVLFFREFSALFIEGEGLDAPNYYLLFKTAVIFSRPMLNQTHTLGEHTPLPYRDSAWYVERSLVKFSYGFFTPNPVDFASGRLLADKDFASRLGAVDKRYLAHTVVPKNSEISTWCARVSNSPALLESAPSYIKVSKVVVLAAVTANGFSFKHAAVSLRENEDFVVDVVQKHFFASAAIPSHFYANKRVMLAAISKTSSAYDLVVGELVDDNDIIRLKSIDDDGQRLAEYKKIISSEVDSVRLAA